jgi:AraC-like DNA-binding protein
MAEALGIPDRELRRIFHSEFGIQLKRWVSEVRAVEVRIRLRGSESIAEISASSGFSHPKELAREFRRSYGVTPSEYRKRERARGLWVC